MNNVIFININSLAGFLNHQRYCSPFKLSGLRQQRDPASPNAKPSQHRHDVWSRRDLDPENQRFHRGNRETPGFRRAPLTHLLTATGEIKKRLIFRICHMYTKVGGLSLCVCVCKFKSQKPFDEAQNNPMSDHFKGLDMKVCCCVLNGVSSQIT